MEITAPIWQGCGKAPCGGDGVGYSAQCSRREKTVLFFRSWVSSSSACSFLHRLLGPFLSRIEKGDGHEEEDLRLDCRHERYAARKWPRR